MNRWIFAFAAGALLALSLSPSMAEAQYQQPYAQPVPQPQPQPAYVSPPLFRFRFGVDGGLGAFWNGFRAGPAAEASLRLGMQIDDLLGVYYQGRLFGAVTESADTGFGTALQGVTVISNGAGVDFTFVDVIQLGGGLSVDYLVSDACGGGGTFCVVFNEGFYPGLDLRAVGLFSIITPNDRHGISLGAHYHATWVPDGRSGVNSSFTINLGWELY